MAVVLFDSGEDGEYNGVGFVEISTMLTTQDAFLLGKDNLSDNRCSRINNMLRYVNFCEFDATNLKFSSSDRMLYSEHIGTSFVAIYVTLMEINSVCY